MTPDLFLLLVIHFHLQNLSTAPGWYIMGSNQQDSGVVRYHGIVKFIQILIQQMLLHEIVIIVFLLPRSSTCLL